MHNEPRDAHMDNQRHDGSAWAAGTSGADVCAVGTRPHRHLPPRSLVRPHAHCTRLTPSGFCLARLAVPSSTAQSRSFGGSSAESSGSTNSPSPRRRRRAMLRWYLRSQGTAAVSDSDSRQGRGHGWSGCKQAAGNCSGLQLQSYASPMSGRLMLRRGAQIRDRWGHLETPDSQCAACTCVPAEVRGWAHLSFAA